MEIQHLNEWNAFENIILICSFSSAMLSHALSCGQSLGLSVNLKSMDYYYYCFILLFGTLTTDNWLAPWLRLFWPQIPCIQVRIWDFCAGVKLWSRIKIWNWSTKIDTHISSLFIKYSHHILVFYLSASWRLKEDKYIWLLNWSFWFGKLYPVLRRHILFLQGFFLNAECTCICKDAAVHANPLAILSVLEEEKPDIVFSHTICIVWWGAGAGLNPLFQCGFGVGPLNGEFQAQQRPEDVVCSQDWSASSIVLLL